MEPVYLIASFRRCGSSMMAHALHTGGLPIVYMPINDTQYNLPFGDPKNGYKPNPNGFFSMEGYIDYQYPSFYEQYKGKLLKIPRVAIRELPPGKYKLVFMNRDADEILRSYRSFIGFRDWGMVETSVYFKEQILGAEIKQLEKRGDIDILVINHRDAITEPQKTFEKIRDFGFPIDPKKSASIVDVSLYRHKK